MPKVNRILLFFFFLIGSYLLSASTAIAAPTVNRLMGDNRYKTALAISQEGWPDSADTAVLANGDNFPDALSAAPLAYKYNAPILLTGQDQIDNDTIAELRRLKVKKVLLIGGDGVISENVESVLKLMGLTTVRYAGQDRYDTALQVAKDVGLKQGVFVVTGLDFPDALSVAPIAAAKGMPVLLVPPDSLTPELQVFLSKNKISQSYIVDGGGEISDSVLSQFPNREVIGGDDPYQRNINVIRRFADSINIDSLYFTTGRDYPDGLAASALVAQKQSAIVLLQDSNIPKPCKDFLSATIMSEINILGGTGVINSTAESNLRDLPSQVNTVEDIKITVNQGQKYDLPKTVTATLLNGLTEQLPVTWNLSFINTEKAGTYSYEGRVKGYNADASLIITVKPVITKIDNLSAEMVLGSNFIFPDSVLATMSDNTYQLLPVKWNSYSAMLSKTGSYSFQGTVSGFSQKVTLTLKVSNDAVVNFKDSNLEAAVRNAVGKDSSQLIYKSDILKLNYLDASGGVITDLSGLEMFTNLNFLFLQNTNLSSSELSPIQRLTNLRQLNLSHNINITSIAALKSLTRLTSLDISYDGITDFSPLSSLNHLNTLYLLGGNNCNDYTPVRAYYDNLTNKDFTL